MKTSLASLFPRLAPTLRACVLFAAVPANAALLYWDTTPLANGLGDLSAASAWGTDAFWNTSSTGATPGSFSLSPSSADDVLFNNLTTGGTVTISGAQSASSIAFGGVATTLSGGTSITLGGTGVRSGIFNTSAGAKIISTDILLNAATSAFSIQNSNATGTLTLGNITGGSGVAQTLTIGSSGAGGVIVNGVIANGVAGGSVALTVDGGNNTVTLSAPNTYTGTTTLRRGTLNLDFSAQANDFTSLLASNTLTFSGSGGRLLLTGKTDGGTNSQAFGTKTYTSGAISIAAVSSGTGIVNFDAGTVTRANNLTLDLARPTNGNIAIGNSNDATGIIGPWATVNGYSDYATVSGGNVAALNTGSATTQSGWNDASANYMFSTGQTLTATTRTANTLRYTGTANTIALGAFDLVVNGILHGGASGALTISSNSSGSLVVGASNELVLLGRNRITVNAPVKTTAANQIITIGNNSSVNANITEILGGLNTAGDVTIVANGNNANYFAGTLTGTPSKISISGPGTLSVGSLTGATAHSLEINSSTGGVFTFPTASGNFTGGTTVKNGVAIVGISGTASAGPFGTGTLTLDGGTLRTNADNTSRTLFNPFVLTTNGGTLARANNGSASNPGGFIYTGGATFNAGTLNLANAIFGESGVLNVSFTTNPLILAGNPIVATQGGNLGGLNFTASGGIHLPDDRIFTVNAGITSTTLSGPLTADSAGKTLALAGSGAVSLGAITSGANNPNIEVNSTTGGVYTFNVTSTYTGNITLTSGTMTTTASTGAQSYYGNGGTVFLKGGTLVVPKNNGMATINNPFNVSSGSVEIRAGGSGSNSNQLTTSGGLAINNSPTVTLANPTTAANFIVSFGTVSFGTGANPTFGSPDSNAGNAVLNFTNGISLNKGSAGNAATLNQNATNAGTLAALNLAGVFAADTAGQTLTITGSGKTAVTGLLAGTNNPGLVINGSGTVYFRTAASTYTGGTTLTAGTMITELANALPTGSVLTINGGILNMQQNQEIAGLNGLGGSIINSAGSDYTLTLSGSGSYSYAGDIVPATTSRVFVIKNGSGTQVLGSANSTYTRATTINNGVLEVKHLANHGSPSSIGAGNNNANTLVFGSPTATLRFSGTTDQSTNRGFTLSSGVDGGATLDASGLGKIVFTTGIAINYGTTAQTRVLTLTGTSVAANEFGKVLANNSGGGLTSLVKEGAGTWILSGANTYTGATSVNQGTLIVNGSLGATAVTVANDATLGGSGTIAGAISGAGLVSPGNSAGVQTVGQVDPSGGLDFDFEFTQVGDPTWGAPLASGNDVLRLTNADAFTAALTGDNVLNYYFSGHNTGTQTYRGSFFSTQDITADLNGATHNYFVDIGGTFYALDPSLVIRSVVQVPTAGFTGGTVNNGWTQEFAVTIPEPGTLALLGLALAALALSRRRR